MAGAGVAQEGAYNSGGSRGKWRSRACFYSTNSYFLEYFRMEFYERVIYERVRIISCYWPGIREFLASGVQRPWHRDWL